MDIKPYLFYPVLTCSLAGLLLGYHTGIIGGSLVLFHQHLSDSSFTVHLLISTLVTGAVIGSFSTGSSADHFGRKPLLTTIGVALVLGTVLSAMAGNFSQLVLARLLIGFGVGTGSYLVPLYLAEIAPTKHRGKVVVFNSVMIAVGFVLAYAVSYFVLPTGHWRYLETFGLLPSVLFLLLSTNLPESPRWLSRQGSRQKAYAILARLWTPNQLRYSNEAINNIVDKEHKTPIWPSENRHVRVMLITGCVFAVLAQGFGFNLLFYYGPLLFERARFELDQTTLLVFAGLAALSAITAIGLAIIIDDFSKRQLTLTGSLIGIASLIVLGDSLYSPNMFSPWLAIISSATLTISYTMGIGSLLWLIVSELSPLRLRGYLMGLIGGAYWLAAFAISLILPASYRQLNNFNLFWLFACIGVISYAVFFYWVPETRKRSLEELEGQLLAIDPVNIDYEGDDQQTIPDPEPAGAVAGQSEANPHDKADYHLAQDDKN